MDFVFTFGLITVIVLAFLGIADYVLRKHIEK